MHYGLDFCPAFWDWLIESNAAGKVFSIEKVEDEIDAGADELADWASDRGPGFFLKPDAPVIPMLATVSTWANVVDSYRRSGRYRPMILEELRKAGIPEPAELAAADRERVQGPGAVHGARPSGCGSSSPPPATAMGCGATHGRRADGP